MQPHRFTSTRVVYENHWMRLREDRLERADGRPGLYTRVENPPTAGISNQAADVWLATGLEPSPQDLEATEHGLNTARVAVAELESMIASGELCDAAPIAAWHLVTRR